MLELDDLCDACYPPQMMDILGGASGWRWARIPRHDAPPVVRQFAEASCGPACGEMLLRDRGFDIGQNLISEGLALPTSAVYLALRMSQLSSVRWLGAFANVEAPSLELVTDISAQRGSWAALLEPTGFREVGQWVVVDGVSDDEVILIRDPDGSAYGMPITEFLELWHYSMMVIEVIP